MCDTSGMDDNTITIDTEMLARVFRHVSDHGSEQDARALYGLVVAPRQATDGATEVEVEVKTPRQGRV